MTACWSGQATSSVILSFIPGASGSDGWAPVVEEEGLAECARLLRTSHQAVAEWRPAVEPMWFDGSVGGLKLFAEAYGLVSLDGLVDRVIMSQRQQVEIVRRLAEREDRRQVDLVASGYLLELQDRIQWSVAHRHLMD